MKKYTHKRMRTNQNGLVSHGCPNGKAYMGRESILRKKFKAGVITSEELREYAEIRITLKKKAKKSQYVYLRNPFTGDLVKVSRNEVSEHSLINFIEPDL